MFGLRFYVSTLWTVGFWLLPLCMLLWIFMWAVVHFRTLVTLRRVRVRVRVRLELRLGLVKVRIRVRIRLGLDLGLGLG